MPVIDIHSHVFSANKPIPKAYMRDPHWDVADRILGTSFRAKAEAQEHLRIETYLDRMGEWGIDIICINNVALSVDGARAINEFNAELVAEHVGNMIAFAAVPMGEGERGARELEYAVNELGFRGAKIYPWLNDIPLDDPSVRPVYEAAADLDVPVLTHTTAFYKAYSGAGGIDWLDPTYDNPARMFDSGILRDVPNLKMIFAHLAGGFVHYIASILRGNLEFVSLLERFYVDMVPAVRFGQEEIRIAIDTLGVDHVLFGLDYPWIDLDESSRCVSHFRAMDFKTDVQQAILGGNAVKLLNL
jgi:predicted TIM-barrel fold metal-dependent hydrolase